MVENSYSRFEIDPDELEKRLMLEKYKTPISAGGILAGLLLIVTTLAGLLIIVATLVTVVLFGAAFTTTLLWLAWTYNGVGVRLFSFLPVVWQAPTWVELLWLVFLYYTCLYCLFPWHFVRDMKKNLNR